MCARIYLCAYNVGVDRAQAVAVRHTVSRATAAQRMRTECRRARPDEGRDDGNVRGGPTGRSSQFIGRQERSDGPRTGDGASDWARVSRGNGRG